MDLKDRVEALRLEIVALSEVIAKDGWMTEGSKGQPVAHPAIASRHAAIALLHKLEAQLPPEEEPNDLDRFLQGA